MFSKWSSLAICLLTLLIDQEITFGEPVSGEPFTIYVSSSGNDGWSGKLQSANAQNTDGPLATLTKARDAIRQRKSTDGLPDGATVWVAPGRYELDKPFSLEAADSGNSSGRITYRASPGGPVILSGSKILNDFWPVTETEILDRVPSDTRGHLREIDLSTAGIRDVGSIAAPGKQLEVFANGQALPLARWPNTGFAHLAKLTGAQPIDFIGLHGDKTGRFTLDDARPIRWTKETDLWLHGYWFWDWSDAYQKVETIDTTSGEISLSKPYHNYGYREGQRCYALNVLCELDVPGEWYMDRDRKKIYLWPPEGSLEAKVTASVTDMLLVLQNCSHIILQGFTIEECRDTGVSVSGGEDVTVQECSVRNVGGSGITLSGAKHRIIGCEIADTGENAISAAGGDRTTLSSSEIVIENNHIQRFGRLFRTYNPAVSVSGVGMKVRHNLIHDGPHNAVMISGNDHQIELNEIYNVCYETDDVGAIYLGRDWTGRGNVIRNNYFHDISRQGIFGAMGVYLDDQLSGTIIEGNVFYKVACAAFIGGGRDNLIEGNEFIDCPSSVHIDARGLRDRFKKHSSADILRARLAAMPYQTSPWKDRYPSLVNILDEEPLAPKGNIVRGNVSVGGQWTDFEEQANPYVSIENNLIDVDPHFIDRDHRNFQLQEDSPAWKVGFVRIPFDQIGLDPGRQCSPGSVGANH